MKKKTYIMLSHLPVIKSIVDIVTGIPFIYHYPGHAEEWNRHLGNYLDTHPDEILTQQLIKKLQAESVKKE